jgi:hypothetical protein
MMKFDLLESMPEPGDFAYEKNIQAQSVFGPFIVREENVEFRKGRHCLDG